MPEPKEDTFLRGQAIQSFLVGTDDEIKTQLSLLFAICQNVEASAKGLDLDFYKFADLFESGFQGQGSKFIPSQNAVYAKGFWGSKQKNRPKIRVLYESSKDWQNQGFALIELQPDRTVEEECYMLFGTPMQLIQQVMFWMNLHIKLANLSTGGGTHDSVSYPMVKRYCMIRMHFKGIIRGTTADHLVIKSFRLMTDDPKSISNNRLKSLGERIHEKFNGFTFVTGHEAYTYNDPEKGFSRVWGYFIDAANAKKVYEQMLDIPGYSPNWKRLTKSTVVEPGDRFDLVADHDMQANVRIRLDRERPIADVKFKKATIKFPAIKKEFEYVNEFGFVTDITAKLQDYAKTQ